MIYTDVHFHSLSQSWFEGAKQLRSVPAVSLMR